MTDHSPEYKILRFLNDRYELYDITDHAMRLCLYDVPKDQLESTMIRLREIKYVKNKDLKELGLTITDEGKTRLQQMQKVVDNEKNIGSKKPIWKRFETYKDILGIAGILSAIIFAFLNYQNSSNNNDLKQETKALRDSISYYHKYNR